MAAVIFEVQPYIDSLTEVGVPKRQAKRFAELMGETFIHYADKFVTQDYLDARFGGQKEYIDRRFTEQTAQFEQRFSEQSAHFEKRFSEQDAYIDKCLSEQRYYMDERFAEVDKRFAAIDVKFARIDSRFNELFWMMGIGFTVLIIPQLQAWFS